MHNTPNFTNDGKFVLLSGPLFADILSTSLYPYEETIPFLALSVKLNGDDKVLDYAISAVLGMKDHARKSYGVDSRRDKRDIFCNQKRPLSCLDLQRCGIFIQLDPTGHVSLRRVSERCYSESVQCNSTSQAGYMLYRLKRLCPYKLTV